MEVGAKANEGSGDGSIQAIAMKVGARGNDGGEYSYRRRVARAATESIVVDVGLGRAVLLQRPVRRRTYAVADIEKLQAKQVKARYNTYSPRCYKHKETGCVSESKRMGARAYSMTIVRLLEDSNADCSRTRYFLFLFYPAPQETVVCESKRWESSTMTIVPYSKTVTLTEQDQGILSFYPAPQASKFVVTQSVMEKALTKNNYTTRMHDLLYIEEMAQYSSIARYNVTTKLQIINRYLLMPSTVSTAKYAQGGELFARMKLIAEISEDTAAGRLLLNNVQTVVLAPLSPDGKPKDNKVYEVKVEDKGKSFIFLRQPPHAVTELGLRADTDLLAEVQFSLNRLPLCEMHHAVDKLPDMNMVFPDLRSLPSIPWTPSKQWSDKLDSRLNAKQKEAIVAMTTAINHKLPPILLVGPFGTGKTFTLAQAIKQIAQQEGTRVLVCTHSNSAADLYIKDYLHSFVEQGLTEAKPLRVYYRQRWVQTVNPTVQRYCLVTEKGDGFNTPTKEDILKHRVIVVTLSTSRSLTDLGLDTGTKLWMTFLELCEAAGSLHGMTWSSLRSQLDGVELRRTYTLNPLAPEFIPNRLRHGEPYIRINPYLQASKFRCDLPSTVRHAAHMFVSASPHECDFGFLSNAKLLKHSDHMRAGVTRLAVVGRPRLTLLRRSHAAIITFASQVFYNNKLVASGNVEKHSNLHPLSFFCAMGQDVQDQNSTTFYNNAEVYEIVERVAELQKNWPKSWGRQDENSIGVVTPYADQVYRIRAELRKHRMFGVCVERVLNVQGKQFRAIFLSTVRHDRASHVAIWQPYECDFGFLSNAKLLNTAITRAQSLVAVVGDPVSLCSVGKCR
ncbi:PREDICTED: probable helicase with zinc finger domain [Priapulus caudatus]|uniref:Probable helicase with zinc finger domain n=1 Tax=Priapulus caudatus TaxID=37621 RepID=A0ABM1F338_PRICU|nr:PREDICTED: probable helicase with zinc finger domain [Priapulus caudatus]